MHAEMRRFLYDKQEEGSTIPGFPGSFTEDWNNYVAEKFGKKPEDIAPAEHRAMAENFIDYIANGLQEFDNNQLERLHYEAIAWDAEENKNEIWEYRQDDKIENRPQQCSR